MELFSQLESLNVSALLRSALQEDLGQGDLTTAATVAPGQRGRADIVVKESSRIVFCGGVLLPEVFALAGANPEIAARAYEGQILDRGDAAALADGARCDGDRLWAGTPAVKMAQPLTTSHPGDKSGGG